MNYYDVKDILPPIMERVRVFFETSVHGGHGLWWEGSRISETHFQLGSDKKYLVSIDMSNRQSLGTGVTHWADMNADNLPNLCRRIQCCAQADNLKN